MIIVFLTTLVVVVRCIVFRAPSARAVLAGRILRLVIFFIFNVVTVGMGIVVNALRP